jgi:hypothetical protein
MGWWKDRDGRKGRKSIHHSTSAQGLFSGIPYAGWWRGRERKRKGGKIAFLEREQEFLRPIKHPFGTLKASIQIPLICFFQTSLEPVSGRVHCDADPECQPNY